MLHKFVNAFLYSLQGLSRPSFFYAGIIGICCCSILTFNCTTQDGIIASEALTGSIQVVEKNNLNAAIFIDFKNTKQTTTNGIIKKVPIGKHRVHIYLDKYRTVPEFFTVDINENSSEKIYFELKPTDYGELHVTTSPENVLVKVDSIEFGYAPLHLEGLSTGEHVISFYGGNYTAEDTILDIKKSRVSTLHKSLTLNQSVVIEHFANTSCPGCPEVTSLILKTFEEKDNPHIYDLEYHTAVPVPDDIFYKSNPIHNDMIFTFYNPRYIPYVYVDGIVIPKLDPAEIKSELEVLLDKRMAREPEYALSIQKEFSDSGTVSVYAVRNDINSLYLKVHYIQDKVEFENPQGLNGEKEFFNIFTSSVPNPDGVKIELSKGERSKIPIYFNSSFYPNITIYVIAYLQDINTKEIKQSIKVLWK